MGVGNSLAQNPFGPPAENLESAIEYYNKALEVFIYDSFPEDWAMTKKIKHRVHRIPEINNLITEYISGVLCKKK